MGTQNENIVFYFNSLGYYRLMTKVKCSSEQTIKIFIHKPLTRYPKFKHILTEIYFDRNLWLVSCFCCRNTKYSVLKLPSQILNGQFEEFQTLGKFAVLTRTWVQELDSQDWSCFFVFILIFPANIAFNV